VGATTRKKTARIASTLIEAIPKLVMVSPEEHVCCDVTVSLPKTPSPLTSTYLNSTRSFPPNFTK